VTQFFPAIGPQETSKYIRAKVTIEIQGTSSPSKVQVARAYVLSNDGITWDIPVVFTDDSYATSVGYYYPDATDPTETIPQTKRFVRIGLLANQITGSSIEHIRARCLIELEAR
jgi:hypothetical protein